MKSGNILQHSMFDYLQLTRPRIVIMVLLALAVAAWTSGPTPPPWHVLLHALMGCALITAGSVALNQRIEHRSDARMSRTADRPVPAGRMAPRHATAFGMGLSTLGLAYLAVFSTRPVLGVAAASWLLYVAVYTPLKKRSAWQTPIGAVAGAMPALIGAAAADSLAEPMALSLFAIMFLWQFPHAMAIAWLYRDQYAEAGIRLATVRDPSGRWAGVLAVAGAAVLLPVGVLPATLMQNPVLPAACATVVGILYLGTAIGFLVRRNDAAARWMLWASIVHLPAILLAIPLVGG